uniref:Uncharacterized protein n=1 Tax=Erpetoichthys calabaricus TaxID=27687 RepID=A0A8C4T295_ERPCA
MSSEDKTLEPSDHGPSPAPGSTAATPVGSPATTDKRPRGRPRKDGIAVLQKTRKKCRSRGKAALDDEDSMDSVGPAEADPVLEPADTQTQPVDRMPSPCAERTKEEPLPPLPLEPAGEEMRSSEPLCAFCYCGERSLLGQGELKRFGPTPGYAEGTRPRRGTGQQKDEDGDGSLRCRVKEQSNTVLSTETPFDEQTGLFLEEFGQVGLPDDIDVSLLLESSGHCWAHQSCAIWSHGVCQQQEVLRNVDKAVDSGSTKHCTYCKRLGATIRCCEEICHRWYHYPCAAAAGTFQDIQSHCLLCPEHIEQAVDKGESRFAQALVCQLTGCLGFFFFFFFFLAVPLYCRNACVFFPVLPSTAREGANCAVCDSAGDLLDQLFCTSCGQHYHGLCLDIAVTPLKRAGWQCPDCKICQTCRNPGEDSKMLVCDTCDKGYHTFCLQPVMDSIPTNGWRCKKCRVCEQCGTRSSPQWHHNSLLCDNCYQQTDDSLACLLCGKPVHVALQKDMMCCQMCKRWIHLECEKPAEDETFGSEREHYVCPLCKPADPQVAQVEGSSELPGAEGLGKWELTPVCTQT